MYKYYITTCFTKYVNREIEIHSQYNLICSILQKLC